MRQRNHISQAWVIQRHHPGVECPCRSPKQVSDIWSNLRQCACWTCACACRLPSSANVRTDPYRPRSDFTGNLSEPQKPHPWSPQKLMNCESCVSWIIEDLLFSEPSREEWEHIQRHCMSGESNSCLTFGIQDWKLGVKELWNRWTCGRLPVGGKSIRGRLEKDV